MSKKKFVIGIDPGVNTGIAMYDREFKSVIEIFTHTFWEAIDYVQMLNACKVQDAMLVIIEAPKKTGLYADQDKEKGGRRREKIASNVGSNSREAELLAEGIERLGFEVRRVRPTRSKWTAKDLQRITGITDRTNQHVRDAIQLCWGV